MAMTNAERVGKALETLRDGLFPYIERMFEAKFGPKWRYEAANSFREEHIANSFDETPDIQALLILMWNRWNDVFANTLGHTERNYISELRNMRNDWAHQQPFTTDDTYRALDTMHRLLQAISAPQADQIDKQKGEVLRVRYEESARKTMQRAISRPIDSPSTGGLRPWREIITPHPDVAKGTYQQAEFAADLGQVVRGEGSDEYRNPQDFYQRTYLTEGLQGLLINALRRLSGNGGEPVMELQTNFGGGKTHSMLALYHLFSGVEGTELFGVEPIMQEANVTKLFSAHRAVLSGQAISPAQPSKKEDGTVVKTLWGELAWQLGAYHLVAESDQFGANPGDNIRLVLEQAQPCIILIDEWVTHTRQLYVSSTLPAGSFDANISFAQSLTEAARAVPRAFIVASLPSSDTETGGEGGKQALARLKQVFERVQVPWRPASTEEGYEIVRRRLFEPLMSPELKHARDSVILAYMNLYKSQKEEFPAGCAEESYKRRLESAYPFHPELFDHLYDEWSMLERFQQTRGVLRLMATVINTLWKRQDNSLLIMPAAIPFDESDVQNRFMDYLDHHWRRVIEKDVIQIPLEIDQNTPNLGRNSVTRRVARTIFMGSAPIEGNRLKGINDKHIKLGCAQPSETPSVFGDALRRLSDQSSFVYSDDERYWYGTNPSVASLALDRAAQKTDDEVYDEIVKRLEKDIHERGLFLRVVIYRGNTAEIADEMETRLIVLGPRWPYNAKITKNPAIDCADVIIQNRGNAPRYMQNTLTFLAPEKLRLDELAAATRQYLAWNSILEETEELNLDAFQKRQAETKKKEADETINLRMKETYQWVLAKFKESPAKEPDWMESKTTTTLPLAVRAGYLLKQEGQLILEMAASTLRQEMDKIPLWNGNHIKIRDLLEMYAKFYYLTRVQGPHVIQGAIREGISTAKMTWEQERFAYADAWDEQEQRYRGLRLPGEPGQLIFDGEAVLVLPAAAIAQRQKEREEQQRKQQTHYAPMDDRISATGMAEPSQAFIKTAADAHAHPNAEAAAPKPLRRFHGSIQLNPLRPGTHAGQIGDEIVSPLAKLPGAKVEITLEIQITMPEGVTEKAKQDVEENARILHINTSDYSFEEE